MWRDAGKDMESWNKLPCLTYKMEYDGSELVVSRDGFNGRLVNIDEVVKMLKWENYQLAVKQSREDDGTKSKVGGSECDEEGAGLDVLELCEVLEAVKLNLE